MAIHMLYDRIQFIAYCIPTTPVGPAGSQRYLGKPLGEASKDIEKRCQIMKNAIDIARNNRHVSRRNKTLKLFMAPEFYFRGGEGAYKEEHISEIFSEMRDLTKDKAKYGNWLFVLGTAVAAHDAWWQSDLGADPQRGKEIWNVCMIQKGGFKRDDAGILRCCQLCGAPSPFTSSVIVYKEYVSDLDFIGTADGDSVANGIVHGGRRRLVPVSGGTSLLPGRVREINPAIAPAALAARPHPRGARKEMSKTGLGGQSVFMIDGITFGIEVCVDHITGRLRDSHYPPASKLPWVQVHLIPACAINVDPARVACMQNGYIFCVDGDNLAVHCKRKTGMGNTPADFANINVADVVNISLKGCSWLTVTHKKYFSGYGQVAIFQEQNLPAPVQAA